MRAPHALLAALAAAALLGAGCGAPDELDSDDDKALSAARESLDDAIDTEETIRTSPEMATRLVLRVRRLAGTGNATALEDTVPALADDGQIDEDAVAQFLENAQSRPAQALVLPAGAAVDEAIEVVDDSGADEDTKVPHARDVKMERYLAVMQRDIADIWPELADRLGDAL